MLHIFLADGFEEIEALTTIDILRRCDLDIQIVSITGSRLIHGSHGISIMAETVFRKGEIYKSNGLILPGGMPGARQPSSSRRFAKSITLPPRLQKPYRSHLRSTYDFR